MNPVLAALAAAAALLAAAPAALAPAQSSPQCSWMNTSLSPDERAAKLVAAMNIDQKIAMLAQSQPVWAHYGVAGYVPGHPGLCIPQPPLHEARPGGGRQATNNTAFPAP